MKSKIHEYQNKYATMSKNIITLIIILSISISSFAQQGINYKAIIKDSDGNVLANQDITVRFIIERPDGSSEYIESHNTSSDVNGIIRLNIGEGTPGQFNDFETIDWSKEIYNLEVAIRLEVGGSFIVFDETPFKTVPYALHAANVSGLEKITENDGAEDKSGWRLMGTNPENYEPIGMNAVDLSVSDLDSSYGASGLNSFASGYRTEASGSYSSVFGYSSIASGDYTIASGWSARATGDFAIAFGNVARASDDHAMAIGDHVYASDRGTLAIGTDVYASGFQSKSLGYNISNSSIYGVAIGAYNIDVPNSIFTVGNGYYLSTGAIYQNALVILKNGNTGISTNSPNSLFEVAHKNGAPTTTNLTNAFNIHNIGSDGQNNTTDDRSWQMYTEDNGYLLLFKDGAYRGSFNSATGVYGSVSDRQVKKDITPLDNGILNKVMQLNPVSYLMKEQTDTKRNLGLISQEVQEIFPSITNYIEDSDLLALSYTELIPILIKALQEQQEIIDRQNSKIETITKDLTALKSIEARINQLEAILKTPQQ